MFNPWDRLRKYWFHQGWVAGVEKAELESDIEIKASEELIDKQDTQIKELENQVLERWFVDKNRVFSVDSNGLIKMGGNPITKQELAVLKADVLTLKSMPFWTMFTETVKQKAIEKAVINSKVDSLEEENLELLAGKMMIHNLGIIKSLMDLIERV